MALVVLPVVFLLFTGVAMAGISPHGGYSTGTSASADQTDFCLTCHDVHQAAGDYVLMRDPTVTQTCATCHALYGAPADNTWTGGSSAIWDSAAQASVSQYSAYENVNAVSGHRLGVALNGVPGLISASIPGSNTGSFLKVIRSLDYYPTSHDGAGGHGIYSNESVTGFAATNGLYCASCHTPHGSIVGADNLMFAVGTSGSCVAGSDGKDDGPGSGSWGNNQLVTQDCGASHPKAVAANKLLSNKPNHGTTSVTTYNGFCIACHNKQDDVKWDTSSGSEGIHNHPPHCVSCHSTTGGSLTPSTSKDYPHTSMNQKLMSYDHDGSCTGCHSKTKGLP
ncbi:MAG: cytochrome c3 family protein [Thermoleophilia bacterium]